MNEILNLIRFEDPSFKGFPEIEILRDNDTTFLINNKNIILGYSAEYNEVLKTANTSAVLIKELNVLAKDYLREFMDNIADNILNDIMDGEIHESQFEAQKDGEQCNLVYDLEVIYDEKNRFVSLKISDVHFSDEYTNKKFNYTKTIEKDDL